MKTPLFALALTALATTAAPAALVAHWKLDADSSDATGNGHNGTVDGSAVTFGQPPAPGLSGGSADFSGTGHIDVPWSAALNPSVQAPDGSGSFTVTLWAFPTTVGGATTSFTDSPLPAGSPNVYYRVLVVP